MRDIEFKAWGVVSKKMYSWDTILSDKMMSAAFGLPPEQCRLVWLQYTGLKDMVGNKIFEGDILKCNGGAADFYFVVGFDHARFVAKVDWLKDKEIDDFGYPPLMTYIGWKFIPEYSVVGNIYENPELLKKK